jgi:hypothetical protein
MTRRAAAAGLLLLLATTECTPRRAPAEPAGPAPVRLEYEAFWRRAELVVRRPVTGRLEATLMEIFVDAPQELDAWPRHEYAAIPLGAWLAALDAREVGTGDHLVITNVRGEQLHLRREDIAREEPVIVIGIDAETNLYKMFTTYQITREYSWKAGPSPMPVSIRPVGPFLFFPRGAPPHLEDATMAGFGLAPNGFRFMKDDPLAVARGLPPDLREALVGRAGCLKCHSLRGAGARAHHVRAADMRPQGGFALPLEEYPEDVLRRFLFDQEAVAASFGVTPLTLPEPTASALFSLVTRR